MQDPKKILPTISIMIGVGLMVCIPVLLFNDNGQKLTVLKQGDDTKQVACVYEEEDIIDLTEDRFEFCRSRANWCGEYIKKITGWRAEFHEHLTVVKTVEMCTKIIEKGC